MIIQIHTSEGIISLDTTVNSEEDFAQYGLKKSDYFDIRVFLHSFAEKFNPIERLELSKEAPSFITELQYKNFAEIKIIRDYLYSQQKLTEEQVTKFNNLFLEQGINLDNL